MKQCAKKYTVRTSLLRLLLVLVVLLPYTVPQLAFSIENYANAKFSAISPAQCIYPHTHMTKQFDLLKNSVYPRNTRFFTIRHIGEPGTVELQNAIRNPVTWDVGMYSGMSMDYGLRPDYQRGHRNDGLAGTSAFQLLCKSAGFLINTFQFNHQSGKVECPKGFPECQGGPHAIIYEELGEDGPFVFNNPGSELTLQVYAKLPFVHWMGNPAVAQQYMFATFVDQTTGSLLAWVVQFYDSRPFGDGNGHSFVSDDGIMTFVSTPIAATLATGQANPYVTQSPFSAGMHNRYGWGHSERFYRVHLKREQMVRMLQGANFSRMGRDQIMVSEFPEDWSLYAIGIAAEISWNGDPSSDISIGGSWRHFEAFEAFE